MKYGKVMRLVTVCMLAASLLAGCNGNKDTVMNEESDTVNIWEESNSGLKSIGIDDALMERILANVQDFTTCTVLFEKDSVDNELLCDNLRELLENRRVGDEDAQCPEECEEYLETGDCEHIKEIPKHEKIEFNQDEEVEWIGGMTKIKDIKLNVISYSTYYMDDKSDILFIVHLSGSPQKSGYSARVHYNADKNVIESIEI